MPKTEKLLTTAPRETVITVNNGGIYPNLNHIPGDSVDEHKYLEEANVLIAEDEIHQENENL